MRHQGHRWQPGSFPSAGSGGPVPPNCTALPVITTDGTPQTGETITTTDGTWTGAAPITFTYQWQRNGVNIAAATAKTYVLVVADEGQSLRVNVTATNTGGNLMRSANPITPTSAIAPPVNTTAPVVSGTATVGSTLTTTDGVWTGPTPTYTYKWQRDGADIGATANTYVLVGLDGGHNVRCVVTATNSAGFASANSNAIAVAAPPSLQSEIMADGPYAYWRGGGYTPGGIGTALADSSGNARALHLWNDAQVPESAYPKPGASLIPSAAGDPSIDFLVNSNFWNPDNWPSISGSWTISLWCKPRSGALANFTWHDIARNNGMGVLINYSSPNYVFEARQVRGGSTYSIISAPVVVNTLYHVAAVYTSGTGAEGSGTGSLQLFVNNVRTVLSGLGDTLANGFESSMVLAQYGNGSNGFDGLIDEVAVYNKALSAARIAAHYNAGIQ